MWKRVTVLLLAAGITACGDEGGGYEAYCLPSGDLTCVPNASGGSSAGDGGSHTGGSAGSSGSGGSHTGGSAGSSGSGGSHTGGSAGSSGSGGSHTGGSAGSSGSGGSNTGGSAGSSGSGGSHTGGSAGSSGSGGSHTGGTSGSSGSGGSHTGGTSGSSGSGGSHTGGTSGSSGSGGSSGSTHCDGETTVTLQGSQGLWSSFGWSNPQSISFENQGEFLAFGSKGGLSAWAESPSFADIAIWHISEEHLDVQYKARRGNPNLVISNDDRESASYLATLSDSFSCWAGSNCAAYLTWRHAPPTDLFRRVGNVPSNIDFFGRGYFVALAEECR